MAGKTTLIGTAIGVAGEAGNTAVDLVGQAGKAAVGVAGHAANGAVDVLYDTPTITKMHGIDAAQSAESIAYRERLDDVTKTAETADNVLTLISDPKKALSIVIILAAVVLLLYIFRKSIGNVLGSIGQFLSKPFKDQSDSENAQDTVMNLTGSASTRTYKFPDDYDTFADTVHAALKPYNEVESNVYSILGQMYTDGDWAALKERYKTREYHTNWLESKREGTLEATINDCLGKKERRKCVEILMGNNISDTLINISTK